MIIVYNRRKKPPISYKYNKYFIHDQIQSAMLNISAQIGAYSKATNTYTIYVLCEVCVVIMASDNLKVFSVTLLRWS